MSHDHDCDDAHDPEDCQYLCDDGALELAVNLITGIGEASNFITPAIADAVKAAAEYATHRFKAILAEETEDDTEDDTEVAGNAEAK